MSTHYTQTQTFSHSSSINVNDSSPGARSSALKAGLRCLERVYALQPEMIMALGSSANVGQATVDDLSLTHIVQIDCESVDAKLSRGDIRMERDENLKVDKLRLIIPSPVEVQVQDQVQVQVQGQGQDQGNDNGMQHRTETVLTPRQIAAARDFLILALPHSKLNKPLDFPTSHRDPSRALIIAPYWHLVRDHEVEVEVEVEDVNAMNTAAADVKMRLVTDHNAAADLVAIAICYFSSVGGRGVEAVARVFEDNILTRLGMEPLGTTRVFNGPEFEFDQGIGYDVPLDSNSTTHDINHPAPSTGDYTPSNNVGDMLQRVRWASNHYRHLLHSTSNSNSNLHTSDHVPKYILHRPPPVLTSSTRYRHGTYSYQSHELVQDGDYQSDTLCDLPRWMYHVNGLFWASRISRRGLWLIERGLNMDGRDPAFLESLTARGVDIEGPPLVLHYSSF